MLMVLGGALFASGGVGVATVGGSWAGLDGGALGAKLLVAMDEAMQMAGLAVVAPTVLAILHEVDVTNAERAAASRLTHPRVAIGS